MTTISPTTSTPEAPAPLNLAHPENFNVVDNLSKIQKLEGDQVVTGVMDYGPGLLAGVALFLILLAGKRFLLRLLNNPSLTNNSWRYWLIPFVEKISGFLLLMIAVMAGLQFIPTSEFFAHAANTALGLAILIQIGLIASTVLKLRTQQIIDKSTNKAYDPTRVTVSATLSMIGQIMIWVVILLLSLENIGVDVTTLIAGVGIGGIAVAFAFKSILEDVFASLSIAFDKPFVIGDFIISGDHMGTVERIGMKNIRLRSLSGEQIIINNNDILASRIRNYGRMYERRVVFTLGIEYGTGVDKLRAIPDIIKNIIEGQSNTRFDRSHFRDYGTNSLNFETVYYMTLPDYNTMMNTQQTINLAIYERFERERIGFALPPQMIPISPAKAA